MKESLHLHIPACEELWYRQKIMQDPDTMSYNKGYAADALRLLLQYAFEKMDAKAVHNDFEEERSAAVQAHLAAGFTKYRQANGILELLITRDQYFSAASRPGSRPEGE